MHIELLGTLGVCAILIALLSAAYLLFALLAVELFAHRRKRAGTVNDFRPAVTILKPICGLDPELAENLRSFCRQDYPDYQLILGLHDENDPALPVIESVIRECADADVSYVVDSRIHGTNYKVSNLVNMFPTAKHDYILISDSDMRVPADYLTRVMAPFADCTVGAVTCLYSASARGGVASKLNSMFINEWFFPSVLVSKIIQPLKFCLGATMVVRRELLQKIGGLSSLVDYLADDYLLGKAVYELGYKIHLADVVVENVVEETSFKGLFLHELRWARTLRRVEPVGYFFTFLTDALVTSGVAAVIVYLSTHDLVLSLLPFLLVLAVRLLLHVRIGRVTGASKSTSIWLIPVRDILSFCVRVFSYTGTSIQWRNNNFNVTRSGLIYAEEDSSVVRGDKESSPEFLRP